ncbi:MAG TPA: hypothetical protein VF519_17555 [Mycobacteriales bacterium]|jgi:hypothetical protein
MKSKHDPDGVDRKDESAEVHENVRTSADGVESPGAEGDTATGLIGNGQMVTDPRYVAQR